MARAGQGHVEQAQVFTQALLVGLGQFGIAIVQPQLALAVRSRHTHEGGALPLQRPEAGRERQQDDGVFQALAFVYRDHLDEVGVTFQAHDLFLGTRARRLDLGGEPADQRLFALQRGTGVLQQLSQVQHIGQAALAPGVSQPARRQAHAVQGLAQHGQHTLALPDAVQRAQQLALRIKGLVVGGQPGEVVQRQAHEAGGQAGAHGAAVQRVGHGAQPEQQILGFGAGEHRLLVRQVHRHHAPALQLAAHRIGFAPGAHQHGDVARTQPVQGLVLAGKTHRRVVEPLHDLLGAGLGQMALHGVARQGFTVLARMPGHGDGGHGRPLGEQALGPALRPHGLERQRVVRMPVLPGAEPEGRLARTCFSPGKPLVHRRHQRLG